jgi:hypothetical protein
MEIAAYCPLTRVIVNDTNRLLKTLRLPFDKLRENAGALKRLVLSVRGEPVEPLKTLFQQFAKVISP